MTSTEERTEVRQPEGQPADADRHGRRVDGRGRRVLAAAPVRCRDRHPRRAHRLDDRRHRHADAGLRLPEPGDPQARPGRRRLRLRQGGLRRLRRLQLGDRLLGQRACAGNTFYWVFIMATMGAFFPAFGDGDTVLAVVAVVGRRVAVPLPDRPRRQGRRGHQPDRHRRQGRADPGVHRDRRASRSRPTSSPTTSGAATGYVVLVALRAGQGHDADHGVRVPRHRGRQRLLPVRQEARGRRRATSSDSSACSASSRWSRCCPTACMPQAELAGARPAVDGGVLESIVGPGVDLHQRRRDRLGARRLPGLDADGRRGPVHPGHAPTTCRGSWRATNRHGAPIAALSWPPAADPAAARRCCCSPRDALELHARPDAPACR